MIGTVAPCVGIKQLKKVRTQTVQCLRILESILTIKEFDSWNSKREQTLNQIKEQKELEKNLENYKKGIDDFDSKFKVLLDNLDTKKTLGVMTIK